MIILFTAVLLCFCTWSIVLIAKQPFGHCLPVAVLCIPFFLFFSQFITDTFSYGIYAVYIFAGIAIPLFFIRRKKIPLNMLFSPGLLGFIIVCGLFFLIDNHWILRAWDDYSHWGVMVKEMLRLDRFYSIADSRLLIHKDYPPFLSLFELWWCRISGGFKDSTITLSVHVFSFSLIIPPFLECSFWDKVIKSSKYIGTILKTCILSLALVSVSIFIISCLNGDSVFNSICKDVPIALMFSFAIYLIFCDEVFKNNFSFLSLVLVCTGIILTKQVGIAFVLVILLYYVLKLFLEKHFISSDRRLIRFGIPFGKLIFLFSVPLLFYKIWSAYVHKLGIAGQFMLSDISIKKYLNIIINDQDSDAHIAFLKYIRSIFCTNIGTFIFPLTFFSAFLLILAFIVFLKFIGKDCFSLKNSYILIAVFVCGTIGYTLMLSILYQFSFSAYERDNLAGFSRYLDSYLIGEIIVLFGILVKGLIADRHFHARSILSVLMVVCLFINNSSYSYIMPGYFFDYTDEINEAPRTIASMCDDYIKDDSTVFILSSQTYWMQYRVNFFSNGTRYTICYKDYLTDDLNDSDIMNRAYSDIFSVDYLFVQDSSESFNNAFSRYNNGIDFYAWHIYKVVDNKTLIDIT